MADCETKKRKKTYAIDGKECSATWFHKIIKKRALAAEKEKENQLAELRYEQLEKMTKTREEIEFAKRRKERTNHWLQETLSFLSTPNAPPLANEISPATPSPVIDLLIPEPDPLLYEPAEMIEEAACLSETESLMEPTTTNKVYWEQNSKAEDPEKRELQSLYGIFARGKVTLQCQKELLEYMRNLTPQLIHSLPLDGRSLRPPRILFLRRELPPGEFIYFGIQNILALPNVELFDKNSNEVQLSLGMDGIPIFRQTNGVGFFPIVGSVGDYPVFLIGLYCGVDKPTCANRFLQELVDEINHLCLNGLHIDGKTYKFRLQIIVMDAVAMAYILGVKSHAGYNCCRKCCVEGDRVQLQGVAKNGRSKFGVRLLDIDAPAREHRDFVQYFTLHEDPHVEDSVIEIDNGDRKKKTKKKKKKEKECHHLHPTILSTVLHFDVIQGSPLDYMHLVCLGIMKLLLSKWSKLSSSVFDKVSINERLINTIKHCPREFQRKPQSLKVISDWKATQFRMFLLYIGVVILQSTLDKKYMLHFYTLVIAMRSMCRQVDESSEKQRVLDSVSSVCSILLKNFVTVGVELFGESFAVYNVHSVIHMPADYRRLGALDNYSAFKYESFLGRVKSLITANFEPMMQLVNKYFSLLNTNRRVNYSYIDAYYEVPDLRYEQDIDDEQFIIFNEMKFKSFVIRANIEADRYVLMGINTYVCVDKILKDKNTDEIYIAGKKYLQIRSLFSISKPCSFDSRDVGISVCAKLSTEQYTYKLCQLNQKCFALPLYPEGKNTVQHDEWVLIQFLH